jgi:hypothetical protein
MLAGIVYLIGGIIEVVVGLRFIFLLLGASPSSTFVSNIYHWSTPLVSPFAGIFGQSAKIVGPGAVVASVFDWTALIALVVYGLIIGALSMGIQRH